MWPSASPYPPRAVHCRWYLHSRPITVSKLFLTLLDTDEDTCPITHPRLAAAAKRCRFVVTMILFFCLRLSLPCSAGSQTVGRYAVRESNFALSQPGFRRLHTNPAINSGLRNARHVPNTISASTAGAFFLRDEFYLELHEWNSFRGILCAGCYESSPTRDKLDQCVNQ